MNIRPKVSVSCVSKIYFGDFGCSCDFLLDLFPPLWMSFQCLFFCFFMLFLLSLSIYFALVVTFLLSFFSICVYFILFLVRFFSVLFFFCCMILRLCSMARDSECVACCVCLRYLYTGYCSEIFSVSELFRFNRSVFGFWFSVYFMYVNRRLAEGY